MVFNGHAGTRRRFFYNHSIVAVANPMHTLALWLSCVLTCLRRTMDIVSSHTAKDAMAQPVLGEGACQRAT